MKKRYSKNLIKIVVLSIAFIMPIFATISNADNLQKSELTSIINKYNKKDIIVENGIVLLEGESLDLSQYPNWEMSNDKYAKIDKNGILTATNQGTVYLSQEINKKVHIIEVYVANQLKNSLARNSMTDRNYYKVFLDPGHGGEDPGAIGSIYRESDLNLQIAELVKLKLEDKGIQVKMSRTGDTTLTLEQRANMSNDYDPDVFVSIHQNSYSDSNANGIETYYHKNKQYDKPLSDDIQTNLIAETNGKNRGVKSANFGVLRMSEDTASLVECGFISNEEEEQKLASAEYQDEVATAISNAIEQYLKENVILNSSQTLKPVIKTGKVSVSESLNVRSGYGTGYNIIGKLYNGERVQIVDEKNGWYEILYNQGYGYVSASYITLEPETQDSFKDIKNHWAKSEIEEFSTKGYINGYEDGNFNPDKSMTRAEFVKIINKFFGFTQGTDVAFKDISKDLWSYNDISIAVKEGYINGYSDNTFKPDGLITREEASKIISTITKLSGDGILSYNDKDQIGDWAKAHVDALTDNGILQGVENNYFMPQKSMTRAEAVVILSRIK